MRNKGKSCLRSVDQFGYLVALSNEGETHNTIPGGFVSLLMFLMTGMLLLSGIHTMLTYGNT